MMEAGEAAARDAQLITPMSNRMAVRAGIFEEAPETGLATTLGLMLNLINVFLYMTNYNLIIPVLSDFCEHLGVAPSTGGLVIGCSDIMAIAVSLLYSYWTNTSFRQPLLFSCIMCLAGNLLVTVAYDWGGFPVLLIGRLLTGTGAARALNRRYIADFVSKEGRTAASVGFVAASAAGMSLGPFIPVPLDAMIGGWGDDVSLFGFTLNVITLSCWIMIAMWIAFVFCAMAFFEDPVRLIEENDGNQPDEEHTNGAAENDVNAPLLPDSEKVASRQESTMESGDVPSAIAMMETDQDQPNWFRRLIADPHLLPSAACIVMLFMLKLLQQGAVSSVPVFARAFFDWSQSAVGLFMTLSNTIMLPMNFGIAGMSSLVSDTLLMAVSLCCCLLGCFMMVSFTGSVISLASYLIGFALILIFTNALEGVSMSVLSKVIHPDMAKGTFNAGLLSTQSGSVGRLFGNFSIAVLGGLAATMTSLSNMMYLSFAGCVVLCMALFGVSYTKMVEET